MSPAESFSDRAFISDQNHARPVGWLTLPGTAGRFTCAIPLDAEPVGRDQPGVDAARRGTRPCFSRIQSGSSSAAGGTRNGINGRPQGETGKPGARAHHPWRTS